MPRIKLFTWCMGLLFTGHVNAQVRWMLGGGICSPPRSEVAAGQYGLQTMSDRTWQVGIAFPSKKETGLAWGVMGSVVLRSPFYELDRALPYYPWKPHLSTYRLESIQLFPYFSFSRPLIKRTASLVWEVRVGPVFQFHEGSAISTTTAYKRTDRSSFILYRLGLDRNPMAIPFLRAQVGLRYSFQLGDRVRVGIQPYGQWQWGDRSRIWYQSTPQDPIHASSGHIKNRAWSFGFQCRFERRS